MLYQRCFYSTIKSKAEKILQINSPNILKISNNNEDRRQNEPLNQKEIGGPKGPEPTRYGDWEQKGRATDF